MHDEFERIDWLKARFEVGGLPRGTVIGIGDDAAVLDTSGPTVLTVDTQVEGVHFRRELLSPEDLGWRALIAATSDVYAMGASPVASLSALTLPRGYAEPEFEALIDGLADAGRATGAQVVGGNLSRADALTLTTTVLGAPFDQPLGRAGANPGDALYVTGTLGSAALGLRILESSGVRSEGAEVFVSRWRRPRPTGPVVETLARIATACIDVSDGCLQDLGHLRRASKVRAVLRTDALPFDEGFEAACHSLGVDPIVLALTGGEDYELLFTAPRSPQADSIATVIGSIEEGGGVAAIDANGAPMSLEAAGFRHFS